MSGALPRLMPTDVLLALPPEVAATNEQILLAVARELRLAPDSIGHVRVLKKSLDARSRTIVYHLQLFVYLQGELPPPILPSPSYQNVTTAPEVIIAGSGPAGLFAALRLITLGIKPIVLERGKDVRARRRDLATLNRSGIVNPDSNYCFGEGGAGTYSDGKLYTRATKRGNVQRLLEAFVFHGADENILYEAHPHIGTNRLPGIVEHMRQCITDWGGEVHFETALDDLSFSGGKLTSIRLRDGRLIDAKALILATGHSARDIFFMLDKHKLAIEAKPFALGVRIEHPQALIDSLQYHCETRSPYLPPASYSLTTQAGMGSHKRGVFSFCMCPGGIIAPAATAPGEVVVNGWSPSKRNNPYANSGMVVSINEDDFKGHIAKGTLAGVAYQAEIEQRAFEAGGGNLRAPAQRVTDFLARQNSSTLPGTSYVPGVTASSLWEVLPIPVAEALAEGLVQFGKKMSGYLTDEAVLLATESRTSSPVRIPRHADTLMHPEVQGLFPCGEGAGYAGGIVSAALDGERCAEAAAQYVLTVSKVIP